MTTGPAVQFIRQYKHCEHHAPTNNQDSLARSICEKAGYDQHNFPHITPLSHCHSNSHEDIPKLTIHDRSSDAVSHWRRFWWWSFMSQADRWRPRVVVHRQNLTSRDVTTYTVTALATHITTNYPVDCAYIESVTESVIHHIATNCHMFTWVSDIAQTHL